MKNFIGILHFCISGEPIKETWKEDQPILYTQWCTVRKIYSHFYEQWCNAIEDFLYIFIYWQKNYYGHGIDGVLFIS